MSTLERAIEIAAGAHSEQRDRAGEPYILHPLRVLLAVEDPAARIAAALHDVVEDSSWTLADLRREGFAEEVVRAVDAVTRREGEPYDEFVLRSCADPLGREVKVADVRDNLSQALQREATAEEHERIQRYRAALAVLTRRSP